METPQLKSIIESLVFVSEHPLKAGEILQAVHEFEALQVQAESAPSESVAETEAPQEEAAAAEVSVEEQLLSKRDAEESKISKSDVQQALEELSRDYLEGGRGIILTEVAGGWQFRTRPENGALLRAFFQAKPTRMSKPSLETLAIVAYRQPITRVEIDEIRGVDSGGVVKTLLEKNLLRIVGKKEEAGRPMLYGTTQEFLELFQLKSLKDLPTLKDFRELEEEFASKANADGTVVENTPEDTKSFISQLEETAHAGLEFLDAEEEAVVDELESSLKNLRQKEKEVFAEEEQQQEASNIPAPAAENLDTQSSS